MIKKALRNFALLFFLFGYFAAQALPTFISGRAIKGNGLVIRVSTYSDRISFEEKLLDYAAIGADEQFQLGFEVPDIKEIFIQIGNQRFSFLAEAGKNYRLVIDNIETMPKSAVNEQKPLHIVWDTPNVLNATIDYFEYDYGDFLEKNFVELYKFRDAPLLKSFEDDMQAKLVLTSGLSPVEYTFLENYLNYRFADLKLASKTVSETKIGMDYLQNKPVLYTHPSYMLFFTNYFKNYFVSAKRQTSYHDFIQLFQENASVSSLLDYMGKDPVLIQERLRELVLLYALKEVYYSPDFKSQLIANRLQEIAEKSKFSEHRDIARTILKQLESLQKGAPAPALELSTTSGEKKSLTNYKGRYVYLVFVSDNCPACIADQKQLHELYAKYKTDIAFVSVLVNYTQSGLNQLIADTKAPWDVLLFKNNFDLLNTYRVRNFPLYILLDPEGKILLYPAQKPHENIERYFDFLLKRDQKKKEKPDELFR